MPWWRSTSIASVARQFVLAAARAAVGDAGTVARQSGRPIGDATVALDAIARVAGLGQLEEAVERALFTTPPPSRLTAWQGRALLDDIRAWRVAAATKALAAPVPPEEAVEQWEARHRPEVGRAAQLLATLSPTTSDPLAVTALTLRRLQIAL